MSCCSLELPSRGRIISGLPEIQLASCPRFPICESASLPGTFYGHFESAWDSADATNTSFPGTSYGKSAGENAEAKNTFLPGTFLLNY